MKVLLHGDSPFDVWSHFHFKKISCKGYFYAYLILLIRIYLFKMRMSQKRTLCEHFWDILISLRNLRCNIIKIIGTQMYLEL